MSKVLSIIFLVIICSAFYFPIRSWAFPMVNTKMLLAAIGLVIFVFTRLKRRTFGFKPDLFWGLILCVREAIMCNCMKFKRKE